MTRRFPHPSLQLEIFYFTNILILFYLLKKNSIQKSRFNFGIQDIQEKINILKDQNTKEIQGKVALQEKIKRYNSLKNIIEEINQDLGLGFIADKIAQIAFSLIASNKGNCVLYLVDERTQKLKLFKAKTEDKGLVIKAKEGDIFDAWVLKHTSPLFVDEIKKDFRFDLDKLKSQDTRNISSLISAPFISENRFLGILRLDSPQACLYSQDDLRLLMTICDVGAVALENGEYFEKTRELAIHDGLTALYTKGYFLERLSQEFKRSSRQNLSLSLLMIDIDYFKNYNDRFGHTAGDIVLKNLSLAIVDFLKYYSPIISRFGGEEFCIILPGIDKKRACGIAEEVCQKVEDIKITLRRQPTNITISIGVATFPGDASEEEELIIKADRAMYEAKQKGRNRVVSV